MIDNQQSIVSLRHKTNTYLNIVFLNQKLNHAVATDDNFANIVHKTIGLLKSLETQSTDEQMLAHSPEFAKAYQAYYPQAQAFTYELTDEDDVEDLLSSLQHYVKNSYELDLNTFYDQFYSVSFVYDQQQSYGYEASSSNTENQTAQHISSDQVIDLPDDETKDEAEDFSEAAASQDQPNNNGEKFEEEFKHQYLEQAALMVWNQQVIDNKIYIFKTKPKIIPILKSLIFAFLILLFVVSIVTYATYTIVTHSDILYGQLVYTEKANGLEAVTTTKAVRLSDMTAKSIPVQLIASGLIAIFMGISIFKKKVNENNKYAFKFGFFGFFIVAIFIIAIVEMFNKSAINFHNGNIVTEFNKVLNFSYGIYDKTTLYVETLHNIQLSSIDAFQAPFNQLKDIWVVSFVFKMIEFSCIFALLVVIIIAMIFRPKYDHERNALIIQQIREDILNNKINPNQYMRRSQSMFSRLFDL
ncbi:hypothetical protein OF376_00695 [Ureaplasma miroungigenitalium]|uniref:Uncharacterized protein n=1 Tax=Ureaplasma miroungigenitalium TaxID=1042321 RepID=A0ABT3BM28_9BACT|nr:hypothetical protein [Ureaplasma miroungigenitalium]MCV3728306.1 hypothetical protein [Ureaplasma miroungigenitalium]